MPPQYWQRQDITSQYLLSDSVPKLANRDKKDALSSALLQQWLADFREESILLILSKKLEKRVIENSNVSGSPLSRFAPAKKSAQIISKQ